MGREMGPLNPDTRTRARSLPRRCLAVLALSLSLVSTWPSWAEERSGDLVGQLQTYVTNAEDTLLDVARRLDLGVPEILAVNPDVDPWLPGEGTPILLPSAHLLPDAPREGLVINLAELRLYYFDPPGQLAKTSTIGIGRAGFTTPLGTTKIVRKQTDPTWYPTASTREDRPELPASVPPGPDNPLGRHALYLGWDTYLVHGTNKPYGVGRRVSRGCIRLYPEQVEWLYQAVKVGTPVTVVHQPVKIGWHDGDLYIEVHPDLEQLDKIEETGRSTSRPATGWGAIIIEKAGPAADRLDWVVIEDALAQRRGIPARITRPRGPEGA